MIVAELGAELEVAVRVARQHGGHVLPLATLEFLLARPEGLVALDRVFFARPAGKEVGPIAFQGGQVEGLDPLGLLLRKAPAAGDEVAAVVAMVACREEATTRSFGPAGSW